VAKVINFVVRLTGLIQVRQGFDGPNLSKSTGGHPPYLTVGVVFQAIEECRCRTYVATIVETAADYPADNRRRVIDRADDRVYCLRTIQRAQSHNCRSTFFFVGKLQPGFELGKHFGLVTPEQRVPGIPVNFRIRKSLPAGVEKFLHLL
jgi:hypothetical protein